MDVERSTWKYAFAGILVTISTLGFGRMSYGMMMPFMMDSLSLSYEQAGMLGTTNSMGYLVMVLFAGILAAKWGSKRLVVIGTILVASGLLYMSFVQSFTASLIAMIVLGVGTAFSYTPLVNIIVGSFPTKRGMMIGFIVSGFGIGTLISSLLIPVFTTLFAADGWRYLWFFYGVLSLLCVLSSLIILKDPPVSLLKKTENATSLWKEVYLHKRVVLVAIIYGLIGFAYLIPQNFLFSFILESGIESYSAGQIMAVGGVMSILSGPLWGTISDRIGRRKSLLITLITGAASVLIPVFFPVFLGFLISQFIWGMTLVGMLSLIQAVSTEQVHPTFAPIVLGYVTIYFASGQLLGPGLGGWIIDYVGGIQSALLLCAVLLFIAFIFSLRLKKKEVEVVKPVPVYPFE
ncbi:YbfB/YjiJ family MFS transporter [Sporosarcina sp. CAU 1771]